MPETCPNCGAEVPPGARACPECGSDEQTGWSDQARASELGLLDEEFNYDEFVKEEFGEPGPKPQGIGFFWWIVALLIAVVLLGGAFYFWGR